MLQLEKELLNICFQ